jgi:hypothetical protein
VVFEPPILHNRRLDDWCCSPGIVHTEFWCGNLKERGQLEELSVEHEDNIKTGAENIKLKGIDWINLAQDRTVARCCEHENEPSGSIQCG